jgi:hypothetical protein
MFSIVAKPFTGWELEVVLEILVPGTLGLNVFLIQIGIPSAMAGAIVLGWTTFAPK